MSVSVFNGDVMALDIAEGVEPLSERRHVWLGLRLRFGMQRLAVSARIRKDGRVSSPLAMATGTLI